jgi:N-acetyl-anhydromuramyl-L-alanine amidase AmpD
MVFRLRRRAVAAVVVLAGLALVQSAAAAPPSGAECPTGLACHVVPAAYAQNSADPGDYGNYDLANRPADGLAVRYIVIHDTEVAYEPTIALFQNPLAYVSAHYVLRSADGDVTQMVGTDDVAWHAGNWWINIHAVGIENEGFALQGYDWYTERLYLSLARLTRYLADRYGIPLDRDHIIGHDEVPGPTSAFQAGMHWDPGPYFDWAHFMAPVGAPITPAGGDRVGRIVTIAPRFQTNRPPLTSCDASGCHAQPSKPANFVYLHTGPSEAAPLVGDPFLGAGTLRANDWGDKAVTGQTFAVADRSGDWTAIWYGGQKAWLEDAYGSSTVPGSGTLVTPKAGLASIPVYGRAYPESVSTATLGYTIPAGQVYVADELVGADYYSASTYNAPQTYSVITGPTRFYKISFNHRAAFVKESDVDVLG